MEDEQTTENYDITPVSRTGCFRFSNKEDKDLLNDFQRTDNIISSFEGEGSLTSMSSINPNDFAS